MVNFAAVIFLLLFTLTAGAVDLTWDANADPSTVGYKVYSGGASRVYTNAVDMGGSLTASIPTLPGQTYFFAVTAYNSIGLESDFSAELRYTIPTFPPLTITVLRGSSLSAWGTAAVFIVTNSQQAAEFFKLKIE